MQPSCLTATCGRVWAGPSSPTKLPPFCCCLLSRWVRVCACVTGTVQWSMNNTAISGAKSASLSYTLTTAQTSGTVLVFTCVATNSVSSAKSPTMTVKVQ